MESPKQAEPEFIDTSVTEMLVDRDGLKMDILSC
jgi:hypothetical protein